MAKFYPILKMLERDGLTVWLVNGRKTRENIERDFVEGGNAGRYKFIPRNDIWIDDDLSVDEQGYALAHELYERYWMLSHGMSYDRAHDKANNFEFKLRREHPKMTLEQGFDSAMAAIDAASGKSRTGMDLGRSVRQARQ